MSEASSSKVLVNLNFEMSTYRYHYRYRHSLGPASSLMSPNAIVSPSVMYRITLFAGSNDKVIQHITDGLTTAFGDIKLEAGPRLSYLNVLIDTSNPQELTRYKTLFLRVYATDQRRLVHSASLCLRRLLSAQLRQEIRSCNI